MTIIEKTCNEVKPLDKKAMDTARLRQDDLTKPRGSLGALEELSVRIAGMQGTSRPRAEKKAVITMAADHGVVAEGVTLYPQEVTRQMVLNFISGGAAINVLSKLAGARVVVIDIGVIGGFPNTPGLTCKMIDFGTKNMAQGPAMTRQQAVDAVETGIATVEEEISKGLDLVGTGEMGIGNTTASSAIFSALSGIEVPEVTGRGTGIDDTQLKHKIKIIEKAISLNRPDPADPIDVLSKVGGFEIGGLAGVILGAASHRVPVVIDGFISSAAALLAVRICPGVHDYLVASHMSAEAGHKKLLGYMKLKPLLNLDMRLGEGTGSVLGMNIIEAAVRTLNEMATFSEAGVSDIE
jgi:nicotinate-nucleotide--dimethylbenzimidazole phosphoribosyltransferase